MNKSIRPIAFALFTAMGGSSPAIGGTPIAVTVDSSHPGARIPSDYVGLSYETKSELPTREGKSYFTPDNASLVKMFQTLGIRNLRIGGNTVDAPQVLVPDQTDIDRLFQFAQVADTKVVYGFRLRKGNPQAATNQAEYISHHYAANLAWFAIGNEPDAYFPTYSLYSKTWRCFYDAINHAVPDARYCGPSLTGERPLKNWAPDFAREFGPSGKIACVTQHEYPGGAGSKVKNPSIGRDTILSPVWHTLYQNYYDLWVPGVKAAGVPYRLEEVNSFYNGGAKDVSDSFAASLWSLDYLYWFAVHGAQGVNFHNGDEVAAGAHLVPCHYATFTSVDDGYLAHPLAYAIKAFNLGARGRIVAVKLVPDNSARDINIVAYAVLGEDRSLYVTLINKEHGPGRRDADVILQTGGTYTRDQVIRLTAPDGNVAAQDGVTLGGNPIHHDGSWTEHWTDLPATPANGEISVKVPACSALIVRLIAN